MTTRTSVITAVRNGANFIAETIASVLSQLETGDEWFIVNDHSTDDTCAIVQSFSDPRIHLLHSPGQGMSAARNFGLKKAQGEYVAFIDHDDLWPPGRQTTMRARLDAMPSIDAVVGLLRFKFESGAVGIAGYEALDGRHLTDANMGACLFRHDIIRRAGGFAEDMLLSEDVDFVNKLKECGMQIELMDIDSLIYRRHATNITNDKTAAQRSLFDAVRRKLARARARTASAQ
ncbi:glycosyltransferase family 2 protein [Rhodoplanes sp. Z2-YC6860]|uniref:glycosyltransferase family 2 protein n=1 Tax=Rhodoplanes sp. Z2-YC6860 TaxID=674703 RepID=UPI00078B69C1|nr:glycosyltransferase family A protein [Rhodoplanes sp. Z2-YC6860]AMN39832.1 glycosyl transferase family protein [Rhodoplanes sp. Z2-YC6860]